MTTLSRPIDRYVFLLAVTQKSLFWNFQLVLKYFLDVLGKKKKSFGSHHARASLPGGRIKTIDAPLEVHLIEEIKGFPTVVEFCV